MGVDDLKATIHLDFYWRLQWSDPRLHFPDMWEYMNPEMYNEGLDITNYIRNTQNPLLYWLPDISFYQVLDMNVVAELIKVYRDGTVYWSRHVVVTFAEPAISFTSYPLDQQNFSIVLQSYAFDVKFVNLIQYANPITYNGDAQSGVNYIQENQLWTFEDYSCYTVIENLGSPLNPERSYATTYINLRFQRQSLGIVYRLTLPIIIFVAVVGISFYGELNERISVSLEILLVISALYIVIGQTIPLVGYLTLMDQFILFVFVILSLAIAIHFGTAMLDATVYALPMNYFISALVDFIFRFLWIPLTLFGFIRFFDINLPSLLITLYAVCAVSLFHSWKRLKSLRRALEYSILQLFIKKDRIDSFKAKGISHQRSNSFRRLLSSPSRRDRDINMGQGDSPGSSNRLRMTTGLSGENNRKFFPADDDNIQQPNLSDDDNNNNEEEEVLYKKKSGEVVAELSDIYVGVEPESDLEQQQQHQPHQQTTPGLSKRHHTLKLEISSSSKKSVMSRSSRSKTAATNAAGNTAANAAAAATTTSAKAASPNRLLKTMLASYRDINSVPENIQQGHQRHHNPHHPQHHQHHGHHQQHHRPPPNERVGEKDRTAHMLIKSVTLTWFETYIIYLWEKFFGVKSLADIEHWKEDFADDDHDRDDDDDDDDDDIL